MAVLGKAAKMGQPANGPTQEALKALASQPCPKGGQG